MTGSFAFNSSKIRRQAKVTALGAVLLMVAIAIPHAAVALPQFAAKKTIDVALDRANWEVKGDVVFKADPVLHANVLEIASKGSASLRSVVFGDGVIEFDVRPKSGGIEGLKFRQDGQRTAEALYFRAQPHCDTSNDCIQYMPYAHGAYEWDLFPEDQTHAPLQPEVWNHVKLVVSGRRMRVYFNRASKPTLEIDHLEGDRLSGALSLTGPASYAHLQIKPGVTEGLAAQPAPDPTAADRGFIRKWRLAGPYVLASTTDKALQVPTGTEPQLPAAGTVWKAVAAEQKGLVNLSRLVGSSADGRVISQVWLKTDIYSDRPQVKRVSLGWLREAWIYVNGRKVFAGRNLYGTSESRPPDGAISLQNGSFGLPLHQGVNTVTIALDDNFSGGQHFGWGLQAHLGDMTGIRLER